MNEIITTENTKVNPNLVQTYLMTNAKNIPEVLIEEIRTKLSNLTQEEFNRVQVVPIKDSLIWKKLKKQIMKKLCQQCHIKISNYEKLF